MKSFYSISNEAYPKVTNSGTTGITKNLYRDHPWQKNQYHDQIWEFGQTTMTESVFYSIFYLSIRI